MHSLLPFADGDQRRHFYAIYYGTFTTQVGVVIYGGTMVKKNVVPKVNSCLASLKRFKKKS